MTDFWDDRYSDEEFAYGEAPNEFLRQTLDQLNLSGSALFPAEGEGRNAVFAASLGFQTTAFDSSKEGRKKALALAKKNQVEINYQIKSLAEATFPDESFDVIGLIYAHFNPENLHALHQQCIQWLRPGGTIILEGFSVNNLNYREENPAIGGPPVEVLLFTEEKIRNSFVGLHELFLKEEIVQLQEGKFHRGTGCVIRYIGQKK